ncbi:MAG TPA: hypothetical protein VJS13_13985 [Pyrinomonadaceae bacterium]|nr:hypothetical protein [Pyrinomonadaceae bacterium]
MAKRIVINLEPGPGNKPQARRKSSRWLRILALLAIVLVVVIGLAAVGGFFWWRHYQSTPAYSLTLLVDAAQRGDVEELAKRIDDEEIARNMAAVVSKKASSRYGLAISPATQQKIDQAMPALLPQLKQTIHDEVAKEIKNFASASEPKPFVFLLITVPSLVKITTEGDIAKAASAVTDRAFELTMRRDADRWKVTGFNNDAVVQRIVDSVMKEMPAIGSVDSVDPLLKNLGKPRKKNRR